MAKITVEIPDPIYTDVVEKRAKNFNMTPEAYLARELILLLGPCRYDTSKWIQPGSADWSVEYEPPAGKTIKPVPPPTIPPAQQK